MMAVQQPDMPVRKRLNHRGPLSIDVSSAWYFTLLNKTLLKELVKWQRS